MDEAAGISFSEAVLVRADSPDEMETLRYCVLQLGKKGCSRPIHVTRHAQDSEGSDLQDQCILNGNLEIWWGARGSTTGSGAENQESGLLGSKS